jgi:nicotinamidase-related amidase
MKKALIIVDMQNDFITGTLANIEGQKIVHAIAELIKNYDGDIIATRDTHKDNYLDTQEGRRLPVVHCIEGTEGWQIVPEIQAALDSKPAGNVTYIDKLTFGSTELGELIAKKPYDAVELCGVCTDICVISNAMVIKAYAIETNVAVHKDLCAGVTPDTHKTALDAMAGCQIDLI